MAVKLGIIGLGQIGTMHSLILTKGMFSGINASVRAIAAAS